MIEYFQPTKGFPALCNLKNRLIKKLNYFFLCNFFLYPHFQHVIASLVSLPVVFKNMFFDGSALLIIGLYFTVVQPTNRVGTLGYDALPPLSGACQKAS